MKRLFASTILAALVFTLPEPGLCEGRRLASGTGSLLRGTVYKHSGMERDGFVTIRTGWKVPTVTPVYRYDFDLLRGKIDKTFFSYLLADVAEIEFLPLEEGRQPVNVKLRNGVVQKVTLVSEDRPVVGEMNLRLKQVDVITSDFGENIIAGGDVQKIVFAAPKDEDLAALVDTLGKALETGRRDDLLDDDYLIVLEKIRARMSTKLTGADR